VPEVGNKIWVSASVYFLTGKIASYFKVKNILKYLHKKYLKAGIDF